MHVGVDPFAAKVGVLVAQTRPPGARVQEALDVPASDVTVCLSLMHHGERLSPRSHMAVPLGVPRVTGGRTTGSWRRR